MAKAKKTKAEVKKKDASLIIIVEKCHNRGLNKPAAAATRLISHRKPNFSKVKKINKIPAKTKISLSHFCATILSVTMRKGVINKGYPGGKLVVGLISGEDKSLYPCPVANEEE